MPNEDGLTSTLNVYKTIPPLPVVLCCIGLYWISCLSCVIVLV